jgi:phospholipase C
VPRFLGLAILIVAIGCARDVTQMRTLPSTARDAASHARISGPPVSPIRHVIVIVQENRTVDNLFNGFPGAATVTAGLGANGRIVPLHAVNLSVPYDPDHSHAGFLTEYAGGAMDGFERERLKCSCALPHDAAYAYVPRDQVQPYWTMAQQYALADEMFQTNEGPSFPAHQYLISGTSATGDAGSLSAMDNPGGGRSYHLGGCDSPAGTVVRLIDLATDDQTHTTAPCFDHETLMDTLDAAGISWRYYEADPGAGLWNAPDAIRHLRYGPAYANVIVPSKRIVADI